MGCPRVLIRFFSLRHEVRLMRKKHPPSQIQMHSCVPAAPCLDSNLFVTLPSALAPGVPTPWEVFPVHGHLWCHGPARRTQEIGRAHV